MEYFILVLITFAVATFGSIVGVGGGFLLMPVLLFMYPERPQEMLTFISLVAVMVNALAAVFNYIRMKRVDIKTGLILGACTMPSAVVARVLLESIDRSSFTHLFGGVLILIGVFILWRVIAQKCKGAPKSRVPKSNWARRRIVDGDGVTYEYAFDGRVAVGTAIGEGFLASFFGIGGGPLVMPILTQILRFPAHIAASTSIMVLAFSSVAGVGTDVLNHIARGTVGKLPLALALVVGVGAFCGAQAGTRLSRKVSGQKLLVLLALAVIFAGARLAL